MLQNVKLEIYELPSFISNKFLISASPRNHTMRWRRGTHNRKDCAPIIGLLLQPVQYDYTIMQIANTRAQSNVKGYARNCVIINSRSCNLVKMCCLALFRKVTYICTRRIRRSRLRQCVIKMNEEVGVSVDLAISSGLCHVHVRFLEDLICLISHLSLPCEVAALMVLSVVLSSVLVVAVCGVSFAKRNRSCRFVNLTYSRRCVFIILAS